MYILFYTDSEKGEVKQSEHVSIKNAFSNKRIKEKTGEITMVVNKTFMSGIKNILTLMLLNAHGELNFPRLLSLIEKIEDIEKGVI